jgi:hypothetical protein
MLMTNVMISVSLLSYGQMLTDMLLHTLVRQFWYTDSDCGLLGLRYTDIKLTAGIARRQEMLIPPRRLVPLLVCPGIYFCVSH